MILPLILILMGATFEDAMRERSTDIDRTRAARANVAEDPGNALGYYGLAYALYQMGRNEEALAVYERLTGIDHNTMHFVPSDKGVVLMRLGRNDEARAAFEQALAIKPDFGHAHLNLAILLIRTGGDPALVIEHLAAADADDPDKHAPFHRVYRGAAFWRMGRLEDARRELEGAVQEMPKDFAPFNYPSNNIEAIYEGRYYLAQVLKALGRSKEGLDQMEDVFRVREFRLQMPIQVRASNRPMGQWPCYEDPDRFVSLLHLWGIPSP